MGMSEGAKLTSEKQDLRTCKTKCEQHTECVGLTWNEITQDCVLHKKDKKPKAKSDFLYFQKDCSLLDKVDVDESDVIHV